MASPSPSPQETEEIKALLTHGKKLQAIKRYREITGEGLVEAKTWIEDQRPKREDPAELDVEEIKDLLLDGKELKAIKRHRQMTGGNLREAKAWIAKFKEDHPKDFPPLLGGCGAMIVASGLIGMGLGVAVGIGIVLV